MRIFKVSYQVKVISIWHQILVTYLKGNIWQLTGRINSQILGVKGLENLVAFYGGRWTLQEIESQLVGIKTNIFFWLRG